jgi:hypothetical protein
VTVAPAPEKPPEPHDFSIETAVFRICKKCAQPDLARVRAEPCRPIPVGEAELEIARKLDWLRRLQTGVVGSGRTGKA